MRNISRIARAGGKLSVPDAQPVDVVIDILEQVRQALDAIKDVEHPEGVQQQEQNNDGDVDGLGHDGALQGGGARNLVAGVDDVEHVDEPEEEDDEEDDLEEHEIEVPHEPFGREVIQVPDFGHDVLKWHFISPTSF
jgi:hypothetical protein